MSDLHWFTDLMQQKLDKNRWKGGWQDDSYWQLLVKLEEETHELSTAMTMYSLHKDKESKEALMWEAIDVANYAMMIVSNLRSQE